VRVHGWVYDIESGQIDALHGASGKFVELSEHPDIAVFEGGQKTV
jgi:carbonic anhydrase